jgi:hypothetical protein
MLRGPAVRGHDPRRGRRARDDAVVDVPDDDVARIGELDARELYRSPRA